MILDFLNSGNSISIIRLGGVEVSALYEFSQKGKLSKANYRRLKVNAGFYGDEDSFVRYNSLTKSALFQSDLNIAWNSKDQLNYYQSELLPFFRTDTLKILEPFQHNNPWLNRFKGKVCVVSSFTGSMETQLEFLDKIHPHLLLSDINWSFVKSVQTNGTNIPKEGYFTNLEIMLDAIVKEKPDLVLLSCGSYSVPLSGILKTYSISSIVVGGSLQLLFGIIGSRWEQRSDYKDFFNEFWIRPNASERPMGSELIEGACYW